MKMIGKTLAIIGATLAPLIIGVLMTAHTVIQATRAVGMAAAHDQRKFDAFLQIALVPTWIGLGISALLFAGLMGYLCVKSLGSKETIASSGSGESNG